MNIFEKSYKLERALRGLLGIVEDYIPDMSEFVETDEWRDAWDALEKMKDHEAFEGHHLDHGQNNVMYVLRELITPLLDSVGQCAVHSQEWECEQVDIIRKYLKIGG